MYHCFKQQSYTRKATSPILFQNTGQPDHSFEGSLPLFKTNKKHYQQKVKKHQDTKGKIKEQTHKF